MEKTKTYTGLKIELYKGVLRIEGAFIGLMKPDEYSSLEEHINIRVKRGDNITVEEEIYIELEDLPF